MKSAIGDGMTRDDHADVSNQLVHYTLVSWCYCSVIFINENENENGEKRENNKFVNEN